MNWNALRDAAAKAAETPILKRFDDPDRARDYSVSAGDLLFDYSKTAMDEAGRTALLGLYASAGVPAKRDAMFSGEKINETEDRAVLHTALRNVEGEPVLVDGEDVIPAVRETLARMEAFAESAE